MSSHIFHPAVPLQLQQLTLDSRCLINTSADLSDYSLRTYCKALSVLSGTHYSVSKTRHKADEYLVTRLAHKTYTDRSAYPYGTIQVGESFRIPIDQEPSEMNLRVHTSLQGKKYDAKFSVCLSPNTPEYIIIRKG